MKNLRVDDIDYNWINRYPNKVDWTDVSIYGKLKNKFIRKYKDYVNWLEIGIHQKLSYETLLECGQYLDWNVMIMFQNIPEELLIHYQDMMTEECWTYYVPRFQKLSTNFIQKYFTRFNVIFLIKYQKLSEQQLRYCLRLNLGSVISKYQKLKPRMICNLKDELDWTLLSVNPNINPNKFEDHDIITIKPYIDETFKMIDRSSEIILMLKIRLFRIENVAKKIQKHWKHSITAPDYELCKQRLKREFTELISIT